MKILIGADIVPTKTNIKYFENGQVSELLDDALIGVLTEADYRIFNLEVPLTDKSSPIKKNGPNLIASTKTINGIKAMGIDFVTLANNHIMDHDEQGLWSTISVLQDNGIVYAGAGESIEKVNHSYILEKNGEKIGIYCSAEREFSIAEKEKAGANPFDPFESLDHVRELKEKCDYVIVLYHGGKEHYRYPSPYLQKVCRKMVEKGADLVVCQHSHCIGCMEEYEGGTIIYGQGNFLFDASESEFWRTSLMIKLDVERKEIEYIPILKKGIGVALAIEEKDEILEEFYRRSANIKVDGFIKEEYQKFSRDMISGYILSTQSISHNVIFRVMNKLAGYRLGKWYAGRIIKKRGITMLNMYECEALRELIIEGLKRGCINEENNACFIRRSW